MSLIIEYLLLRHVIKLFTTKRKDPDLNHLAYRLYINYISEHHYIARGFYKTFRHKPERVPLTLKDIPRRFRTKIANFEVHGGYTILMAAACYGKVKDVKTLIKWGADVHHKTDFCGWNVLNYVANGYANVEMVRLLLSKGVDVNSARPTEKGQKEIESALYWTTRVFSKESYKVAKMLIKAGADVKIPGWWGSPYKLAQLSVYHKPKMIEVALEVMDMLKKRGVKPSIGGLVWKLICNSESDDITEELIKVMKVARGHGAKKVNVLLNCTKSELPLASGMAKKTIHGTPFICLYGGINQRAYKKLEELALIGAIDIYQ